MCRFRPFDARPGAIRAAHPGSCPLHARHAFVLPLDLLPIAWAATRTRVLNASTAYLASQGLTVTAYERWATRIEDLLAGQALSATQLRSAMQVGREVPVSAVLNQMCGEGRLLRDRPVAGWRDVRNTYRRFSEALPHVQLVSCSRAEATRTHGVRPIHWGNRRVRDRRMGCPWSGVRRAGFYLAPLDSRYLLRLFQIALSWRLPIQFRAGFRRVSGP